ncbi:MAG: NUDIX hydrolase [Actinomycetota bacterium]|nr:NUDIX hydrolase [Actinomycetota bacterium]
MDTPKHSVSVAGVVVNPAGQVLVIRRRDNGHWEPPGGVLELGESFDEGVRREVLAETGVKVTVDRLSGVYKNLHRGVVALVFRCTPLNDPDGHSVEAADVRWADLAEVPRLMDPAYAVRISDAFVEPTAVRVHDGVQLVDA